MPATEIGRATTLGPLPALQRRLHGAASVGELLSKASGEAVRACGFERGLVLVLADGTLSSRGVDTIADPASDALRRQSLATPIRLTQDCEEVYLIRRAEGIGRERRPGESLIQDALGLNNYALAALVPETRAIGVLVVDRETPVADEDQCAVDVFAHLLAMEVERLTLRLRLHDISTELRHLTASAHALLHEAIEAPVSLTPDQGIGALFTTAGSTVSPPGDLAGLLSERERAIAGLMVGGRSNREIGEELHLSPDTIKSHVARLVRKLGASNRVEAVARYVELSRSTT